MSNERVRAFCIRAVVWFSVTVQTKQVWFGFALLCSVIAWQNSRHLNFATSAHLLCRGRRREDPGNEVDTIFSANEKQNQTSIIMKLLTHNFLPLASTKCNGFQFRLAHWVACVCCDWVFRYIFIHSFSCINYRYICVSSAIIRPFFLFVVIIMISSKSNTSTMNNIIFNLRRSFTMLRNWKTTKRVWTGLNWLSNFATLNAAEN